ncbi:hypothetical protein [Methylobacterium sp. WL2]|uniref:hypothetical protein n=1 Tax=Methylobacterium sp. WL2 TaxID=2603902 RepID=UPI0011CB8404|nr:hypothetical protein [Methylobacterium sp. WL2]TXN51618.1 hypothetical protein FV241_29995 [Methylobacterium sp. WL2]
MTIVFLCLSGLSAYLGQEDTAARKLGYDDATDKKAALAAGVAEPAEWHNQKVALAAKAQADARAAEVERKRQQEAEASAAADRRANEEKAVRERQLAEKAVADKKEAECKTDLSCWAEKGTVAASVYCKEKVERLAKFQAKWTDAWYETKFSHYRWSKKAPKNMGVVTYIGDKVQFQNGFGAFQNYIYSCDMIPGDQNHVIFDVSAEPGRLD